MSKSKKSSAKTTKNVTKAKAATVTKSAPISAETRKARSIAAYKAHMTRQNQILAASKKADEKSEARTALAEIGKRLKAFEKQAA
jgi:hypothetical protein